MSALGHKQHSLCNGHVRFGLKSRHVQRTSRCPRSANSGHPTVPALHPPLRRCFQQFLKFLLVELGVGRGEMAAGLFARKD